MATWKVSYGRYVQLHVTATEIDVDTANNRSKVRVQSSIYYPGGTSTRNAYPQTLSVSVNGTNIGTQTGITYSLSTSSRTMTLNTYTSGYITHNADGSKSVNVNVSITDNAGDNGRVNQTLVLTKIARASSLTSFSIGAHLKNSTANTVKLAISRQSTSFTHDIQLRDGTTVIQSWNGQGAPTSLTLSTSSVNTLLNRMSSSTSKTLTLRVQTKSGSTNIGSALTRNATATVHADVKPTVSAMTVNISGNGRDKTISKYVQGFSKVAASFTRSAGYGASISSSSIVVRRRSGAADSQTISSNSGTTGRAVALNGLYEIRGTTRDSRGRTNTTAWATITVDAYSTPVISKFDVVRNVTTPTTANASITGGHSHLGGKNPLTLKLEKRLGTGAWSNVPLNTTATSTTATFSRTAANTGNSVTRSYEFRLSLSDTFGARVVATRTISTQKVVLDVHKNEGVGIGKIHERGDLDIAGNMYLDGFFSIGNADSPTSEIRMVSSTPEFGNAGIELTSNKPGGTGVTYLDFNTTRNTSDSGIGDARIRVTGGSADKDYGGDMSILAGKLNVITGSSSFQIDSKDVAEFGNRTNGSFVKFYNGVMICWIGELTSKNNLQQVEGNSWRANSVTWTFPVKFASRYVFVAGQSYSWHNMVTVYNISETDCRVIEHAHSAGKLGDSKTLFAIGRWL